MSAACEAVACGACGTTYRGGAVAALKRRTSWRRVYQRDGDAVTEGAQCLCGAEVAVVVTRHPRVVIASASGAWQSHDVLVRADRATAATLFLTHGTSAVRVARKTRQGGGLRLSDDEMARALAAVRGAP